MTAVLATWLGLLVVTRARRARGAPVFATLCLLLVTWSVTIIIQRITADRAYVEPLINPIEDVAAFLLPALTTHIAISVAFEGRRSATATVILAVGYVVGVLAGIQAVLDPEHPITFAGASFEPFGIPGPLVAWVFAATRFMIWAAGVAYLVLGLREAGADEARRRQLQYAIATVVLGVVGGMLRILPPEVGGPEWIGVSLIAAATVMATYAVVAQHLFIATDAAARAVRWSLAGGLAVVAYVGVLVTLDRLVASALRIDLPIIIAVAVVMTIALFDPIAERLRPVLLGGSDGGGRLRMLQAIGSDALLGQAPDEAIEPALARLARTFELTGAEVEGDGLRVATGTVDPDDPLSLRLPLAVHGVVVGQARFGRKRSGLSFTPADLAAIDLAADYLGSSLQLARRDDAQATALAALRVEHAAVRSRGTALSEVLADAASPASGLHVHALGSLRAERDGEAIRRWGGAKAGSRQAEAVFAFLFDRGERGAAKDEILEIVWPDVDLDRADVAFHRTMLGLRSMLQPDRRSLGAATGVITFHNDRYRLDPAVIVWSDVAEFESLLARAGGEGPHAIRSLEQARALYRGDYLDDCPFYGDSAEVEDRRTALRDRYVDLLIELGERYADAGDRPAATACLRDARALADEDLPRITDALEQLSGARLQDLPARPEG